VIPCWADTTPRLGEAQLSYVFYSDDLGSTWRLGGALDRDASDECEVVERADGTLYMNMRSRQGKRQRAYAASKDGGTTWSAVRYDPRLPEPSCQGSVVRLTDHRRYDKDRVLLAAPASSAGRSQMTVRLSYDECESWPVAKVVHKGAAAYSDLAVTHDLHALLLYEADDYSKITSARFSLEWLTDNRDTLGPQRNHAHPMAPRDR
jgi:sialidase-1